MAKLYIIATPIGNMEDISARALRILSEVDLILCEDTRNTQKLLNNYDIKKPLLSYHQHSKTQKIEKITDYLKAGKTIALVSDAGTPGISDPGEKLVEEALEKFPELEVVSIPGPCAIVCAAAICGFPMDKFLFLGFPPAKNKRKKFFEEALASKYPVIFYESTHRIIKSLEEISALEKDKKEKRKIVVCRELTKKFETIYRGRAKEIAGRLAKETAKGEFVVVISPLAI